MPALRIGQYRGAGAGRLAGLGASLSEGGFVLPRWLRRPMRVLLRFVQGDTPAPRYSNAVLNTSFLAAAVIYGTIAGGHVPTVVQAVTAHSGFAVDQVRVTGYRESSEIDILGQLELNGWTSLIGFDAEAARQRVTELPWVEVAAVRKVYPDALEVQVEERQPFAIWQHGSELSIIEASGRVIAPYRGGRHAALPLVIGEGADTGAEAFVAKVAAHPELAQRVKGYIRVADRRWDLRLDNGVTVKLPEHGADAAIAELIAMDREHALLSRDILAVDLRLGDRVAVQLTPAALEQREKAIAASEKAAKTKRPEKRI